MCDFAECFSFSKQEIRSSAVMEAIWCCSAAPPLRHPVQDARKKSKMEFGRFSVQRRGGWSRAGWGGGSQWDSLSAFSPFLPCRSYSEGLFWEPGQTPDRALPLPSDGTGRKQRCLAFPSLTCRGGRERWWPFCSQPRSPLPALLLSTPGGEARITGFFRQQAVPFYVSPAAALLRGTRLGRLGRQPLPPCLQPRERVAQSWRSCLPSSASAGGWARGGEDSP